MPAAYGWEEIQRIFLTVVDLAPAERNAAAGQVVGREPGAAE